MAIEKAYEKFVGGTGAFEDLTSNEYIEAQTFTVGTVGANEDHVVLRTRLHLVKVSGPAGTLKVQIRGTSAGVPNDTVHAEGTILMENLSTTNRWEEINMTISEKLTAGGVYAVCILSPNATTLDGTNKVRWTIENTSPTYGGGSDYTSSNIGSTWSAGTKDHAFELIGNAWSPTLCNYNDILGKVGKNVLAALITGSKTSLTENFALQAQSEVCAITRFNWVDNYSTLDNDLKYLLNEAVSNLAAIYTISHDMSGYTDRVEAETMINVLRDGYLRAISLLRDQKVKVFVNGS